MGIPHILGGYIGYPNPPVRAWGYLRRWRQHQPHRQPARPCVGLPSTRTATDIRCSTRPPVRGATLQVRLRGRGMRNPPARAWGYHRRAAPETPRRQPARPCVGLPVWGRIADNPTETRPPVRGATRDEPAPTDDGYNPPARAWGYLPLIGAVALAGKPARPCVGLPPRLPQTARDPRTRPPVRGATRAAQGWQWYSCNPPARAWGYQCWPQRRTPIAKPARPCVGLPGFSAADVGENITRPPVRRATPLRVMGGIITPVLARMGIRWRLGYYL